MNAETLAQGLGLSDPRDIDALGKRLAAMLRDGQLLQNRRSANLRQTASTASFA